MVWVFGILKIDKSQIMKETKDHFYFHVFKHVNGLFYLKFDPKLILRQGQLHVINHFLIDGRESIKIR